MVYEWICNGLSDRCGSPDGKACVIESENEPDTCVEYPSYPQDFNIRQGHRYRNQHGEDNGQLRT